VLFVTTQVIRQLTQLPTTSELPGRIFEHLTSHSGRDWVDACSATLLVFGGVNVTNFYGAMHYSAKRRLAIACRLSVCLSETLVDQQVENLGN